MIKHEFTTNKLKLFATGIVATGMLMTSALTVFAATPNNQACLGNDFSSYAKALRPFGQVLTNFVVNSTSIIEGGLGDEVQNHLAGNVPDTVFPNSCNN